MSAIYTFLAASEKIKPGEIGLEDPVKDADAALAGLLSTVYGVAGIICVIIIIIGGFLYVTSGSDASNVKRAREAILGAIVGLVIIMMAFVITQFILGRF